MAISAQEVKRLRDLTGVGMMDCKKALEETDGDFDEAVELLRKKGQKVAAKRADREASEGLVVSALTEDRSAGALAEINCETDFVARNDEFRSFANQVVERILEEQPEDLNELQELSFEDDQTVKQALIQLTGKIGEKLTIRRFVIVASEAGEIISYVHPGSRLGVLVEVTGNGNVQDTGRDVAMQVAALSPIAARRDDVPPEVKEKELEIAREAAQNQNKPDHVLDQIAKGKLERFFKDNVLLEQPFVKDSSMTVQEMLSEAEVNVKGYVRYALGE